MVRGWISYRDFRFDGATAELRDSDSERMEDIAEYLNRNPSLVVGIDASTNPRATERSEKDLLNRRVEAIRAGLIRAGVAPDRIYDGRFGDAELRRDGCVELFLTTASRK